jgi:hypothetical protein
MGFSGDRCIYTWVFLRKGVHLGKHEIQGRTIDQRLLGFAGTVHSFLYFSMGHFPRYESPCKL